MAKSVCEGLFQIPP